MTEGKQKVWAVLIYEVRGLVEGQNNRIDIVNSSHNDLHHCHYLNLDLDVIPDYEQRLFYLNTRELLDNVENTKTIVK